MSQLIKAIQNFICHNQKQTIKYEYLISERHKKVKECYLNNNNHTELKEVYSKLIIESYNDLFKVYDSNKNYIENIFKALGKKDFPRITIKTLHGENVLDIYRSSHPSNFNSTNINENTGFFNILKNNELFYLNNDLPQSFKNNVYVNPRLKEEYRNKFSNDVIDWKDCWNPLKENEIIEYYSSTLILPMSIRSIEDDENDLNFYNHFFQEIEQHKDSRTIWGFLCFDHDTINYFDNLKKDDFVSVGYIISDMLSLYLMYFYNHISGSQTIKKVEEKLYK